MTTTVNLAKDSADQRLRAHLADLARRDFERTLLERGPVELNPLSWFGAGRALRSAGNDYARDVIARNRAIYGGRRQGRAY